MDKNASLIIVCDDKEISYANYLVQLIGQKDDKGDEVVGVSDDTVSAAIFTTKYYKDNLPQISSNTHILFIGHSDVAKEQMQTIQDTYSKFGMHYGWLGKRAVLYVDDISSNWIKLKDDRTHYDEFLAYSKAYGNSYSDALHGFAKRINAGFLNKTLVVGAPKMLIERGKALKDIKIQQYRTLERVFYHDGLRLFMEG